MNIERIRALADLIEKQPHTSTEAASGFCMDNWSHSCGTPSCIAGWALFAENNTQRFESGCWVSARAASYLELDTEVAGQLFEPDLRTPDEVEDDADPTESWGGITPDHAAHTLRHLADTGVVDWSAYERSSSSSIQEKSDGQA